jgi:hypothetical protein
VLAHYLREHPRVSGDIDVLPRQLKDTASRALSGKFLSLDRNNKATLTLFLDAFGFGTLERDQFGKLSEGSAHVRVLSGPRAIRDDKAAALGSPQIKTLSMHDHHYLGPDGVPPASEFRRIVQYFVENLDIRVEFHPDKLPRNVVWAVWDGMAGPIVDREPAVLDDQFAVHRYLRLAEKTAVGFHWDW